MDSKKQSGNGPVIAGIFCLLSSVLAGNSLADKVEHFNGWQAAGYAVVAGIFIAIATAAILAASSALQDN